jgi:Tfp pilus assembly protein PilO
MRRNFNFSVWPPNNPGAIIRLGLAFLLALNLVAGYFVLRPIGGSPEELQQQATEMRAQIVQQKKGLEQTRNLSGKIGIGRDESDKFMAKYFLPRRTAYATIMTELNDIATQSKVTTKESSYAIEQVEGSDTLDMMQITANFEGDYKSLIGFVNMIDKSSRLLILESLNAAPQQNGQRLNVMLKVDTYVREDGSGL